MVQDSVNPWAAFRAALAYPDEQLLATLNDTFAETPATLPELQSLYVNLFEAGLPHPRCPLLETFYVLNRPPGDIILENKLFYQHFGLEPRTSAAPDHLLTQLEFLSWLEHAIAAGNGDAASLERARSDFLARHVSHWIGRAAETARAAGGACYADILEMLAAEATG